MLIVEDTLTNEIRRFFVVDARVGLGSIEVGSQKCDFDPNRMLRFFELVENQLHEFSSRYPESFRYMPRRAYDYLKRPPILEEIYQGFPEYSSASWFFDQFFVHPILDVRDTLLPKEQRRINIEKARDWAEYPPFAPRLFNLQEMRYGHASIPGYACILRIADLRPSLSGVNRNELLEYFNHGLPILIEVEGKNDLDSLLEWMIFLKDAGLETPTILLSVKNHKEWGKDIVRLLDIPNSKILTSGSTITSLTDIIRYLKKTEKELWSSRLVFASSYPETQAGNSISEVISYLLSTGLDANPEDLHRIFAGNLLSLLPPRPRSYRYVSNDTAVAAEGLLGKSSMNELSRILRLLATRGLQTVVSCDFMVKDDGEVDTRSAILSVKEPSAKNAIVLGIISERNAAIRLSGWRDSFSEGLKNRNASLLTTLVRNATIESGLILDSPGQLNQFNYTLLECLRVRNPNEILSALHFDTQVGDIPKGCISINPKDLDGLEMNDGELVVALKGTTGQWWVAEAKRDNACPIRTARLSIIDAEILGIQETEMLDLAKYQGRVVDIRETRIGISTMTDSDSSEVLAYIHLNEERILSKLDGFKLGRGTKLVVPGPIDLGLELVNSDPMLMQGQIGVLSQDLIILRPIQTYRPFNILLCVSTDGSMSKTDIDFVGLETIKRKLMTSPLRTPELEEFMSALTQNPSRAQLAALACLLIVNSIAGNRSEGRLGFVTFSDKARKFSVQKGERVLNHLEFQTDFASEEARISLVYSILDMMEETGGKCVPAEAYRAVVEILEELGEERPTIIVLLTSKVVDDSEESKPFLKALAERRNYFFDVLCFDPEPKIDRLKGDLQEIKSRILPIRHFSEYVFEGYFLDSIIKITLQTKGASTEFASEETP